MESVSDTVVYAKHINKRVSTPDHVDVRFRTGSELG